MDKEFNHSRYWVVWFYDLESWTKFRLATNLPAEEFSNGEIGDIYDCHWQIELLWKFLKMHLKLDRLITKGRNGVRLQIYMILIGYMILQLMEIPVLYGDKLLDKLRYLQLELRQRCSVIHWSYDFLPEALVH